MLLQIGEDSKVIVNANICYIAFDLQIVLLFLDYLYLLPNSKLQWI